MDRDLKKSEAVHVSTHCASISAVVCTLLPGREWALWNAAWACGEAHCW